jgi:hypothetical protein
MSQWTFVAAAYIVALGGTGALLLASWVAMRRAEK